MTHPNGIGVYCRTLSKASHGTPEQLATRLASSGCSWVAFMACWQDRQGGAPRELRAPAKTLRAYAEACRARGLSIWLWGFPGCGREASYVEALAEASTALGPGVVAGWLHDVEVSYRDAKKPPPKGSAGQGEAVAGSVGSSVTAARLGALRLLELELAARTRLGVAGVGVSSYGMAQWHALPWDVLARIGGFGSPQLYTVTPRQVDAGIDAWRAQGFESIIPSVPAYGPNSAANLDEYLGCFVDGHENVSGFAFWSYQQLAGVEWKTIAKWAEQLRARACIAPRVA